MSVAFSPPLQSHVAERAFGGDALLLVLNFGRYRHAAGDRHYLLGAGSPGQDRRQLGGVEPKLAVEMRAVVGVQRFPIAHGPVPGFALGRFRPALEIGVGLLVGRDEAGFGAAFHRHVADGHAAFHRKRADRFAAIFQRVAGAAGGADLADDGEDNVLRGHAGRQLAVDHRAHVHGFLLDQRLRRQHVLDFGGTDAVSERAEGAVGRCVTVAAHKGRAGQCEALFRTDDVANALTLVEFVVILDAEVLGVLRHDRDLFGRFRIGIGQVAIRGRHVVIDHGERLVRRMHLAPRGAQAFEGLRRGHLMDQMAIDIDRDRCRPAASSTRWSSHILS